MVAGLGTPTVRRGLLLVLGLLVILFLVFQLRIRIRSVNPVRDAAAVGW